MGHRANCACRCAGVRPLRSSRVPGAVSAYAISVRSLITNSASSSPPSRDVPGILLPSVIPLRQPVPRAARVRCRLSTVGVAVGDAGVAAWGRPLGRRAPPHCPMSRSFCFQRHFPGAGRSARRAFERALAASVRGVRACRGTGARRMRTLWIAR
eukprot:2503610-Prymnesium_polylepis.1